MLNLSTHATLPIPAKADRHDHHPTFARTFETMLAVQLFAAELAKTFPNVLRTLPQTNVRPQYH